ncbi:DUF2512 family protein [Desulforamulus aquiferis]|uniref:DUF2512 family protein n=1 Tax=Desulforamulus aquiferis TaxID=1397668 RepID=A0AAW7Z820_9FIRM|nr:DUF2512 family protein [Desulforamulus aquiferis]MDO7785974.1 DUF2512 family protein [Desulforamulus aquiferis]RYD02010.1 hypothetical protein N752_26520 [Desulforamulus aquiferis]
MNELLIKLFTCPIIVLGADYFINQVHYVSPYQAVITGLIIAIVAYFIELNLLGPGTILLDTFLDFLLAAIVIYLSSFVFPGSFISYTGVLLTALAITAVEYFQHVWLVSVGYRDIP